MIDYSATFLKEAKQLSKKYKNFKRDLQFAIKEMQQQNLGTFIGRGLYKKRIKNSSNKPGKSGGFRIIIYQIKNDEVILMSVYSKTQKPNISNARLKSILESL